MSTQGIPYIPAPAPELAQENYINISHRIRTWLLTRDHKRIAILYLISVTVFFMLGGAAATMMRLELMTPKPDLMGMETYNRMFTVHGVVMVFLFMIPAIPAVMGNFLVPLMIGARDLAFPRMNLASWYLYMCGAVLTVAAIVNGGVDTGWTFYTPYSSTYANGQVVLTLLGVFIMGFSSIFTGLNFIITIHTMRCPGMTWKRLPLFIWAIYSTSVIQILGTPVLAMAGLLVIIERAFHVPIFDPNNGGDPILFQHLFWFYSHPAVYIMVLPAFGVISELIPCFSRKTIFGYKFVAASSVAIAVISFVVWGHHMFVTGMSMYGGIVFSFLSFVVGVPSAIKVLNWTATMHRASVSLKTPMLYAIGFLGLFVIGGLTGMFLATLATDIHLTDTYFIVAHFHFVMVGGTVMAFMGGVHFWFPKMFGKLYPEWAGRISAGFVFFGFNLTFFPQFLLGYLGMPRRYAGYPEEFQVLNVMSTAGASILAVGFIMPLVYLTWSLIWGKDAGKNPWLAMGMEWTIESPPIKENFREIPVCREEAYAYHTMIPQGGNGIPLLDTHPHHGSEGTEEKEKSIEWSHQ